MCVVGIDEEQIFAPVFDLRKVLIVAVSVSVLLVTLLTYSLARGITIPLNG